MDNSMNVAHIHQGIQRLRKKTIHTAAGLGQQETPYGKLGETAVLSANHKFEQDLTQGCVLLRVSRRDTVDYLRRRIEQVTDSPQYQANFARDLAVSMALVTCGLVGRVMGLESLMSGPKMSELSKMLDRNLPAKPAAELGNLVGQWQMALDPENRKN